MFHKIRIQPFIIRFYSYFYNRNFNIILSRNCLQLNIESQVCLYRSKQFFFILVLRTVYFLSLRTIRIKISSSNNRKMCRLETVVFCGSTLQRTDETVTHIEVSHAHIGRKA